MISTLKVRVFCFCFVRYLFVICTSSGYVCWMLNLIFSISPADDLETGTWVVF